jgi:hypothetical protein
MTFEDENPPKSYEEALERRKRPALKRFDPEKLSHWSITMAVAWIAWRNIDVVREEWDDYRSECADWGFFGDPAWLAGENVNAAKNLASTEIAPNDGEVQRYWMLIPGRPSGWQGLSMREPHEPPLQMKLQEAINQLWLAAGQQKLHATAIKCESRDILSGVESQIEPYSWARLKCDFERSGRAMLSSSDGRSFRDVRFARADLQKLWSANQSVASPTSDAIDQQSHVTPAIEKKACYSAWIKLQKNDQHPSREEDLEFMRSQIPGGITGLEVRNLRRKLAPESWKLGGRPRGSKK